MNGRTSPIPHGRRLVAAAILLLVLVGAGGGLFACSRTADRPNIVIVVWDTCRADRVQVNGYRFPTTPNLVAFAREGTTFRNCFSPSPWTPPSHASLFTGLLPRRHGLQEGRGERVRRGIPLLAETLRGAGYETVCVAANAHIGESTGLDAGFDVRIQCFDSKNPDAKGMDVGERVVEWLAARRSRKPLFLFVNMVQSHIPYAFEAAEVEAVHGAAAVEGARRAAALVTEDVVGRNLTRVAPLDPAVYPDLGVAYDGAVRIADRTTGRILDRLRADGLLERSVVAVCADHGEQLGERGLLGHLYTVAEPVLRVPLVVRWPGRLREGAVENAQVRLQDVYPTLLEAAGVPIPPACGKDATTLTETPLVPRTAVATFGPATDRSLEVLENNPGASPRVFEAMARVYLSVRETTGAAGATAARLYVSVSRASIGGPTTLVEEALYDPVADPKEERNLLEGNPAPAEAETARRLRELGGK